MRRIYLVHCMKKACSSTACKIYAMSLLFVLLASTVSIVNVIANMPKTWDMMYHYDFMMYAFMHTELIVQVLILAIIGVASWMTFSSLRGMKLGYSLRKAT